MKKAILCVVLMAAFLTVPVLADEGNAVDWQSIAAQAVTYIIGAAVVYVLGQVAAWLKKLREKVADEDEKTWVRNILDMATEACESAQAYVQQTYVDPIKGTDEWTDEAKAAAKYYAVERVEAILGEGWMEKLQEVVEDPEKYLEAKIEGLCLKAKK